jgi:hypothetical protein
MLEISYHLVIKKTNIIRGGINDSTKNSSDEKSNSSDI